MSQPKKLMPKNWIKNMPRISITLIVFCILFVLFAYSNFSGGKPVTIYVPLEFIPNEFDPTKNINIYDEINHQIFFPLLEVKDWSLVHSEFLDLKKTRATDTSFKEYKLCLKRDAKFNNGIKIHSGLLKATVLKIIKKFNPKILSDISVEGEYCVLVKLKEKNTEFFSYFTGIESTILPKQFLPKKPIGLGPYSIKNIDNDQLVLVANRAYDISKVVFYRYDSAQEIDKNKIYDFNQLVERFTPDAIKNSYTALDRLINKTYSIFVRVKSRSRRWEVISCLKLSDLAQNDWGLVRHSGFLPKEFSTNNFKVPLEFENVGDCSRFKELVFYVMHENYLPVIQSHFIESGLGEVHKFVSSEEVLARVQSDEELATVIGVDSVRTDEFQFFSFFAKEEPFIFDYPFSNPEMGWLPKEQLEKELLDSGYIVPIGQVIKRFYFHPRINEISWPSLSMPVPIYHKVKID